MADEADKEAEAAQKAYAAAAEAIPVKPEPVKAAPVVEATPVVEPAAAAPAPLKAAIVKRPPLKKPAPGKPAPKAKNPILAKAKAKTVAEPKRVAKTTVIKPVAVPLAAKPAKATPKALPKSPPAPKKPIFELKELIMAKTPDFTKSVTEAVSELQTKTKAAYDKGAELAGEATEFAKGNVEALVESGKILSEGVQEFGKTYVEEAKSAFETATADLKEMAAIKSPTDLFQLQGKLARRNFDAFVAFSSKSSETFVKLANESIAPLSSRMSLAADKISKVAA